MRRTLLLFPIFLFVSFPAFAGQWGSRSIPRHFAILEDVVFAADGRGVTTYDVSDPAHIRESDFDTTDEETYDLAIVRNEYVAVATKRGIDWYRIEGASLSGPIARTESRAPVTHIAAGTQLIAAVTGQNVEVYRFDGSEAVFVAEYPFRNAVLAIAIVGNALYASVDREGTYVYDVPSAEWANKLLEAPVAFARSGNTLWGASRDTGLTAIDVQNPAAPKVLSNTGEGEYFLDGVAVAGNRVFAYEKNNQLRVFNVSDATKPALVSTLTEWTNVLAANGNRVFFAGAAIDAEKKSSETGKPLRVLDATSLATLGEYTTFAGPVSGVWTDGSIAYVVDPPYLRVLDVSKTAEPRELSSLLVPNIQDHIRVKNGLAVLYGRAAVNLIDVSKPLEPRVLANWSTQGHPPSAAAIAGASTFVEANEHSGYHIVDYRNYPAPVQVGGRKFHYHSIAASDDAVYLLMIDVFLVLQISHDRDSVDKTKFSMIADQVDIVPPNSPNPYALVVRAPAGIHVYSLADRFDPQETAFLPLDRPGEMGTGDGVAYITIDGVLHRLNVGAPALTETDLKVMEPMQISVAGEKIVVADRYSVRVFGPDTASPVPPEPVRTKRRAVR